MFPGVFTATGWQNENSEVLLDGSMAVVLTPSGLDYDTGLADQILHRHAH